MIYINNHGNTSLAPDDRINAGQTAGLKNIFVRIPGYAAFQTAVYANGIPAAATDLFFE